MSRKNVEDIYPLSPLQQGILFHTLLASEPGVYFVQHAWTLRGALDPAALERAFQEVVDRHPVLRTAFVWERRERPVQVVRERVKLPFETSDLRGLAGDEQRARLAAIAAANRARGFELGRAPLTRVTLIRTGDDEHRLLWSVHHLLLDGWSTPLVTGEIFALYDAHAAGRPAPRLERPRPYGDYIGWLSKQDRGRAEAFFRHELRGLSAPTPLGVDHVDRVLRDVGRGEALFDDRRLALPEAFAERITVFARQRQITASTLLQAAWGLVLSRYSGEEDVVFGLTVSGRSAPLPGIERMIGLFINTLAVRVEAPGDEAVAAWLAALQDRQAELHELEHTALLDAQGWSAVPRGTPLFESVLVLENYPFDEAAREGMKGLELRHERTHDRPDLPLTVVVAMRRGLHLRVTYDRRRFAAAAIERMLGHVATVLDGIMADPERRLAGVPMLGEAERRQVLYAWNDTGAGPAPEATLHGLFEAQVDRTPGAVALVDGRVRLTYRELAGRVHRLANHLRRRGVGEGTLVGLCVDRSADLVIGLLAVLEAGGAYVPLDPVYPAGRLVQILDDARAPLLVTQRRVRDKLPAGAAPMVLLDDDAEAVAAESDARPSSSAGPGDLAYVIYTSGSTGRPKGVAIEHRSTACLVTWAQGAYAPAEIEGVLFATSVCFDLSLFEIFLPLCSGTKLILAENALALPALPARDEVTLINTVPTAIAELVRTGGVPASVRTVCLAGEPLSAALTAAIYAIPTVERVDNLYGPTEDTTYSTWTRCRRDGSAPTIGRPIAHGRAYILDARMGLVPVGVAGEIWLGGAGVARGYLGRPDLTAERFVESPFEPGARLYRTGDLGRFREDGEIDYLGRADFQVKVRGFRIELGEIEAVILRHGGVRACVVVAREDTPGDKRVVAYVVPAEGHPGARELRAFVREELPEYMVPAAFVALDALPLTPNGKVDRKALPAPEGVVAERPRVPPRGPVEEALAGIFAEALGIDPGRVGAHDGFFELGGHSLRATAAIGRIRAAFAIDLPLRALFEASTPAALAAVVQAALSAGGGAAPVLARGSAPPVLSFAQERLWFLAQLDPSDPSYHIPLSLELRGRLDVDALGRALGEIVRRHEVLRTAIVDVEGRPAAEVREPEAVALEVKRVDEEGARAEAAAEARRPFDLAAGWPWRAVLLRLGDEVHRLLLTMHHVVFDGWSQGVLYRELSALYDAFAAGARSPPSPLAELPVQYADYAAWQRAWLSGEVFARELAWWKERLHGAARALDLPADRPRPPLPSHRGARVVCAVPGETAQALRDLGRREGVTPFMAWLGVFEVLLHRVTGQLDLLVGAPVAGRDRAETEGLVGFFVNTLVLRVELADDLPFRELSKRVKESCLGAYAHAEMPFEQLVREIEPDRDPGRSPLFQVSFTLQPEAVPPPALAGLTVRRVAAETTTAKFDLTLGLFDGPAGLAAVFDYASDLFDAPTVERMAGHFLRLAAGAAKAPERALFELPLLGDDERALVVTAWNATDAPWPEDGTIHELFEAWAARSPDAPALVYEGQRLSYRDLDEQADRLAHHLAGLGVGLETLVGVSMARSPEMIVAILGVLKAGGAWVPLDPAYPRDRLAFMVEDSGARLVLTREAVLAAVAAAPAARPDAHVGPENAAYVIYTSGSTGRPKGVVVEHRGLGNVAEVHRTRFGVGPGSRVLQFSSMSFDASVWETVMALLNGATLVLAPQEALLPGPDLERTLTGHGVTIMTVPPSVLAAMPEAALPALGTIVVAGEACAEDLVRRWAPGRHFWNAYGPTETTICATMGECHAGSGKPSIGRPIANVVVHVLDAHRQPVPIGVPGELCIGGVGVARGYLRRPELTAERFVQSPFHAGERLYRTGDRARWSPGGDLEFLGRVDDQVKLRGFRVELGEIDAVLRQHPGIADAVAVVRDGRLCAYVVHAGAGVPLAELRAHLRATLPEHMVPSAVVVLAALPLTPSGKVDRRALPAPEQETGAGALPRGPVEDAVASIFAQVLGRAEVGAHDGFFEIGGHSLLATQAVARIRAAFGVDLPLRAIFESPTPAALAGVVQGTLAAEGGVRVPRIERGSARGEAPLSFSQERLWFLAQLEPDDPSYVIPAATRIRGPLDVDALRRALGEVVRRHAILRTTFAARDGRPVQIVHEAGAFALAIVDAPAPPDEAEPFDLEKGPLFRARLLRAADDDHTLVLAQHHIISDGWSQAVLNREISALYDAFAAGRPSPLGELGIQYADFAAWQRRWLSGEVEARQLAYWKDALAGAPAALDLPADRARPRIPSHRGDRRPFQLPAPLGAAMEKVAREEGATLFMTLLAAFAALLHRLTGERDLVVGTPIAGRARAETEELVGFFINNLVLRVPVDGEARFREVVRRARAACLGAYAHQDMPFERLVQELAPERDLGRSPLFQVMFTLQNEPRDALALRGLEVTRLRAGAPTAKIDLSVAMSAGPRGLGGVIEYATDLFDAATIDRLVAHLGTLLEGVAADPDASVLALPVLPEAERLLVVETWNRTEAPYRAGTIHAHFEAWAARTPDAVALVFQDVRVTYRALDERARRLAGHLGRLGVGPGARVGVSMARSPEMVVAVLGVLQAGGAWVPLDPAYPADRLAFMVEDSGAAPVLTREAVLAAVAGEPAAQPSAAVGPEDAAYVIYTSGSTGRPKGVVVPHRGLGNVAEVHRTRFGVGPGSRVLQFSSMSFDASVWETVMALLDGATLVLAPQEALLPGPELLRTLTEHAVTVMTVPPSVLAALPDAGLPALGTLVVAGEACSGDLVRRWAPGRRFWNAYGPTEASICATMAECGAGEGEPTIGAPIANVRAYVLDAHLGPQPIGAPGELCVGGVGVAHGYLGRPELTAERFVPSPFQAIAGERLYRTGDRARRRADGAIEFLGRVDHQVKLRGFRIELGEIDALLAQHPGVVDAVTVVREGRLCAYVVMAGEGAGGGEIRDHLRARLPEHMVPTAIVALPTMPLTPSGKVDRGALPAPETAAAPRVFVPPRGPIEEAIAAVFAEVLRVPQVGAHDGFFDLGGHSLLATQAVARIRDALGVELPLRALFEDGTPAGLGAAALAALQRGEGASAPPLGRAPEGGDRPLSFAQERLWFLDQLDEGSAAYVVPLALRLTGPLDAGALRRALGEIVRRHEVLRTTFAVRDGRPAAVVHPATEMPLPVTRLADVPGDARDRETRRVAAAEAALPIRLAEGPVFRARLLAFADDEHALVLTMHHVVADAWALGVLHRELAALYGAFAAGEPSPLPEPALQYADVAWWQRRWLTGEVLEAELGYWRAALDGASFSLDLPTDRPRPSGMTHEGAWRSATVPGGVLAALHALSRREGATLFMTLLGAFDVLLARHTGQASIVVGTPIAGRRRVETEAMVGFFVNTLVLEARVAAAEPFVALLRRVKETCLGAYAHQDMPFERLVQELDPGRDPGRSPLFQALFSMQNAPRASASLPGLSTRSVGADGATAKYDVTLAVSETGAGLAATVEYRTQLFDEATIDRMLGHLGVLLGDIAIRPDAPVGDLAILTEDERRLLAAWNDTAFAHPADRLVHELFEAEAARRPDAVAVSCEGRSVTYRELDEGSNRVAHALRRRGVGPEALVGVCMERSLDLVLALWGVLKAGGAYLPLDPEHPGERLAFMLEDVSPRVILTQAHLAHVLPERSAPVIQLDAERDVLMSEPSTSPGRGGVGLDHLAYVIYTSGSTGRPKAAMNAHGALLNRLHWMQRAYGLLPGDRVLQKTPFTFDVSVWELFWPTIVGAGLVVVRPGGHRDPAYLAGICAAEGITTLHFVPSMLTAFVDEPAARGCTSVRRVIVSGEALPAQLAERFFALGLPAELDNLYGPTEAAIDVTAWACAPGAGTIPIGRPIDNVRIHVLDERGEPQPIGVPGELHIGGVQVGRGYMNRPELTAERFVVDPFDARPGARLYRTGDVARWLSTGVLEYRGRADFQVKIRGFRVELGEIEAVLGQHPNVGAVVVIAREDRPDDKRLVAYVVPREEPAPAAADLRAFAGARLPEHMVPAAFVALGALPLTASGKVDRRALPAPDAPAPLGDHAAPRSPIEEALAGIWSDVLGVAEVGVRDDFFELGGHSLLATRVTGRMAATLGVDLPLGAIFEAPTIAGLAERVAAALAGGRGVAAPPLVKVPRGTALPLSFAQERLWLLDQIEPGDPSYLVPAALRVTGPLDVSALGRALGEIVRRHEVLRTAFTLSRGKPVAEVRGPMHIEVPVTRWPSLSAGEREEAARREVAAEARRPFDLGAAPLLRARLFELGEGDAVLCLTMHHIVSDAWTEGVLHRELAVLYEAYAAGRPSPLGELELQYADYAAWQRAWLSGDLLAAELDHWKQALAGASFALDLPTDRPRPPVQTHAGGRVTRVLPPELLSGLGQLSRREGATLFMTLLAAFDVLLGRYTGQVDLVVGSPIAGRTRPETEGLIGFFINTLVLRVRLGDDPPFRELVRRVRGACLDAYAHQDMPFERLVQELAPERDLGRTPLFQVMFALQNAGGGGFSLPGLDVRGFGADTAASKFDLTLVMGEGRSGLTASLEHSADLFDADTIERMLGHLRVLLDGAVGDPDARVSALPLLAGDERRRLVVEWNDTGKAFPPRACLHELFEAQADRTPGAPAVTFEGTTLSYGELDARAERLAHALAKRGVGPETLVGLAVERSLDTIVGILGILKAGAAYLPLDPDYPRDRLAFMIADARIPLVVTQTAVAERLPEHAADVFRLDADLAAEPASRAPRAQDPASLAYVIYTSGSTGKPKGAMVTHHNVVRLFDATAAWFGFAASDVWTMFHSYAFDFSVWEIWGALLHGGRVVVVPYWVSRAPDTFYALLADEEVTVLNQTPSAFRQLVQADEAAPPEVRARLRLRYVVFGGEALDVGDLRPWWERHDDAAPRLVNMYGITETTVHVTYRPVSRADLDRSWSSVIGRPIPDLQVYVLDAHRQPVPVGVAGELYVGGAGVARGYLARPELTAERFLDDPFRPGNRLYRTGDRARHLASGDVEYLGRIDHQVKIRGHRVELGEIEAALDLHPAVRESVVLLREDAPGDRRLVAYLVPYDGPRPTAPDLRRFLQQRLPDVMVPAGFVLLDALPLTENGKIDRRALPAPEEGERADTGEGFVAPATAVEEQLAALWASVLRLPRVGVHDNFFEIGGDSILSIQVVARAQQAGIFVTPRQIFQHPTVAELAAVAGTTEGVKAEQGPVTGPAPLTPIQRWWLEQDVAESHHWNQAFLLELRERLDPAALEIAVAALLEHHDALRLRLARTEAGFRQTLAAPGGRAPLARVDLGEVPDAGLAAAIEEMATGVQASLDLESGPVARMVLCDAGSGRPGRLLVVIHHLAVDGVSWRVLLEDLWTAYGQALRGESAKLPPKTTSFKQWGERLADHARGQALERDEVYWLAAARRPSAPLPVDHEEGENTEASARSVVVSLGPEETRSLLREVPEAYQTRIDDILLTALCQAWQAWTGSPVCVVDLEGHGREELFADLDLTRTVGWFTALYPLALELTTGGPGAAIKAIKEQIRAVPGRGVGYGLLRYLRADDPALGELRALPRAEASWNYLGQLDQALPEASPFRFARERGGPSHSPRARRAHLLDITASVSGGRLSIQWTYSEARHLRATIEEVAAHFLSALRALIAHCLSPEAGGYTPSDFQEPGLSQNVIDMLAALDDDDDDDPGAGALPGRAPPRAG